MTQQNIDWQYTPTPPAPKKKGWRIRHIAAAYAVGGLILGSALAATAIKPERVEVPGPERIVNKTVEVDKPVTPAACLTALDLSEEAFGYAAQAMGYMSDALTAASKFDTAAITQANTDLKAVTPKMTALKDPMNAAKSECRAAGS